MLLVPEGLRPCLLCATWIPTGRRVCDACRREEWEAYLAAGLDLANFYGLREDSRHPTAGIGLHCWAPGELGEAFGR